jgi:hypothetical protein
MLLESSITLLQSIYSTGITHDDHHLRLSYNSVMDLITAVKSFTVLGP